MEKEEKTSSSEPFFFYFGAKDRFFLLVIDSSKQCSTRPETQNSTFGEVLFYTLSGIAAKQRHAVHSICVTKKTMACKCNSPPFRAKWKTVSTFSSEQNLAKDIKMWVVSSKSSNFRSCSYYDLKQCSLFALSPSSFSWLCPFKAIVSTIRILRIHYTSLKLEAMAAIIIRK